MLCATYTQQNKGPKNYPTIRSFLGFIQIFDAKFTTIAPHSLMVFELQYVRYVKDALSINRLTYIYITLKVSENTVHM